MTDDLTPEPTDYTGYEHDETVAAVKYGQQHGLRDELQELIDDGLSRIYGTFVDATTPGRLAHLLAPLVAAGVQCHLDAAREQALRDAAIAMTRENGLTFADALTVRWLNDRAARIARQHAEGDGDE